MSKHESIRVNCPLCGYNQPVWVWRLIDAKTDPQAREELIAGSINTFRCAQCRDAIAFDGTLTYLDHEKNIHARYFPAAYLEQKEFFAIFSDADGEDLHIVFQIDELQRYIRFREILFANAKTAGNGKRKAWTFRKTDV